jgi:hypothetical protein
VVVDVEQPWQRDAELADPLTLDEMGVRDLLLRLTRLEQEQKHVQAQFAQIEDRYDQVLADYDRRVEQIRESIRTWIERVNGGKAVKFPDAGGAHLRKQSARVRIADESAFAAWALEMGCIRPDPASARKLAEQRFKETGELVHGTELEPETVVLTVRKP